MEVRVLGPLLVVDDHGRAIGLRPKERTLLARLAAARPGLVSDDVLIDALWQQRPDSARKTLHGLVHHLRRALGADAIVRESNGYRLMVVDVDLDLVQNSVNAARRAIDAGHNVEARGLLRAARDRFRGPAFPELDDDTSLIGLRRQVSELELALTEDLFRLDLASGGHQEVIGELEVLVGRDPTRERAWCLLVSALAATGRHADALNALSRARRSLALELGVEPGPALRQLELAVLEHRVPPADSVRVADAIPSYDSATLPAPLAIRSDDVSFVGRRDEMTRLERSYHSAINDGRPRLDIVVGEAGVGKTRLAAEFAAACHNDGALVLFGRCSEFVGSAFEPLQQALSEVADTSIGAIGPPAAVERLQSLLARMSAESTGSGGSSTPAADRHRLLDETSSVIEHLAADRPVLIVFDDVHWASQPTILSLTHLLRRSAAAHLAIIATARVPEFGGGDVIGSLGREPGVSVLRLYGFDVHDVRNYLSVIGADHAATDRAVASLLERTGGNAFMLGELVRSSAANGVIEDIGADDVPELVREVIVSRARRLPPPAFDLLQMASVAGLEFDLELMVNASGLPEPAVVDALDTAIEAQLLVGQPSSRVIYAFTHALARDAFATGMSKARQAVIHHQFAMALQGTPGEPTPTELGRLAYHLLRCSATDARSAGCLCAEQAAAWSMASFAYDDACEWFTGALDTLRDLPSDPNLEGRLQLGLARAATLSGDETRARKAAEEAWRTARSGGDRALEAAAALLYAGEPELNVVGDEPGTRMLATTLDVDGLTSSERVRVMARLGSALSYSEHERAVDLALGSLELARRDGDRNALAYAIRCRLRGWFNPDQVDERIAMAEELTAIGKDLGDGVTESWGLRWQTITNFDSGDIDGIERSCRGLAALAERLHLPNQLWSAAIRLAALRVFQGRFNEAELLIADAQGHAEHINNALAASVGSTVSQTLSWLRGQETDANGSENLLWCRNDPSSLLDRIAREPDLVYRHDLGRLETICSVALTMRRFPHPTAAAATYPYAARYAHLVANFAPGAMMYGSMHLYAGLLADEAGDTDRAIDHLRAAVRANSAMDALPFVALAEHELANMLPAGGEARQARADSNRLAERLGIPWLTCSA